MRNSGLITDELALYMFGYYAILCKNSKNYWHMLNRYYGRSFSTSLLTCSGGRTRTSMIASA
jgi:hypothetical protein